MHKGFCVFSALVQEKCPHKKGTVSIRPGDGRAKERVALGTGLAEGVIQIRKGGQGKAGLQKGMGGTGMVTRILQSHQTSVGFPTFLLGPSVHFL